MRTKEISTHRFFFLKFYGEPHFELFRHGSQFSFQEGESAVACAVACIDGFYACFSDLLCQPEDFFISFVEQVEAADQGENLFPGKVSETSRMMSAAPAWEQELKMTSPFSVSKTRLCSWSKLSGRKPPFFF